MQQDARVRRATYTGTAAAILGLVLFAWFVRRAGADEIWTMVRQVGWGVSIIIAVAGLRFGARAFGWAACIDPPHRLPFLHAFAAVVCGDAFGNLTPLGPIVGEPAKAAYVRDRVPLAPALTALAIENVIYTLSVAAMIAAALVALLFTFDLPQALVETGGVAIALMLGLLAAAAWALWRRPAVVSRALASLLPSGSPLHARLERVREIEERIYTFAARRPDAIAPLLAAQVAFHGLGVLEVYLTWWMMTGAPPSLLLAFVLEGANRLVTVVFKIVPLRLGVDETSTGGFTQLLGYGAAAGTTLAILRKARVLFWTVIGTTLLVRKGANRLRS